MFHLALHFAVPGLVAMAWGRWFPESWPGSGWRVYVILVATMAVDLDHLLADPIYDPTRCSIGFHPLHGVVPIALYALLCAWRKGRPFGVGLLIHMGLDSVDCYWNQGVWLT